MSILASRRFAGTLFCALMACLSVAASAGAKADAFLPVGSEPTGSFEIVDVSPDGNTAAGTNPGNNHVTFIDIADARHPEIRNELPVGGGLTSVAFTKNGKWVLAVARSERNEATDDLIVIDAAERAIVRRIEIPREPDSIAVSPDGKYAAIAIESEGVPGPGSLEVADVSDPDPQKWTTSNVAFDLNDPAFVDTAEDSWGLQPEFVDVNDDNEAVLSFQENNAIGIVDLTKAKADPSGAVTELWSAGRATQLTDFQKGGLIEFVSPMDTQREPDAVVWTADNQRIVAANEGENEGGRDWSIWNRDGTLAYTAGTQMEIDAARNGFYNNDRAINRSLELEGADTGVFGGREYAFLGSERANFLAAYDITDPASPKLVSFAPTGNRSEGIKTVPQRGLVLSANEEGQPGLSIYRPFTADEMDPDEPVVGSKTVPWGGIRGLAAAGAYELHAAVDTGGRPAGLTVSGSEPRVPQILRIRTDRNGRAEVTATTVIRDGGAIPNVRLGGVARDRSTGGWWVVQQTPARLHRVGPDGEINSTFTLPTGVPTGVAAPGDGSRVYVSRNNAVHALNVGAGTFTTHPVALPSGHSLADLAPLADGRVAAVETRNDRTAAGLISRLTVAGLAGGAPVTERAVVATVAPVAHGVHPLGSFTGLAVTPNGSAWTANDGASTGYGGARLVRTGRPFADLAAVPPAQGLPSDTPELERIAGGVTQVERVDNRLFAVGNFSVADAETVGRQALVDTDRGLPAGTLASVDNGQVRDAVGDGAGGWYLTGSFTSIGGVDRQGLAHIRPDGSLDPDFDVPLNGSGETIDRGDGKVFVGGEFTEAGGQPRERLAAVDTATRALTAFAPNPSDTVHDVEWTPAGLYVGGRFNTIGGETRDKLALLSSAGAVDATFVNPQVSPGWVVNTLAVSGGRVYLGGTFPEVAGQPRQNLAAVNATTAELDATFRADANNRVTDLLVDDARLLAGGEFRQIGGVSRTVLASVDLVSGAVDQAFDAGLGGSQARDIAAVGGKIYLAYNGSVGSGFPYREQVVRLDRKTGRADASYQAGFTPGSESVLTLADAGGGKLYAGGEFTEVGVARGGIAAYDAKTGKLDREWESEVPFPGVIATSDERIYSRSSDRIFAVDTASGNRDEGFNPTVEGGQVKTIAVAGDRLVAGGDFIAVDGVARNRLAAFRLTTGTLDRGWKGDANGPVTALAPEGGRILVGGAFSKLDNVAHRRLGAVDADTGAAQHGFAPSVGGAALSQNENVADIVSDGGDVYAAGSFTEAGGQPRRVARFDGSTGALRAWNPAPDGLVRTLTATPQAIVAGGDFANIGAAERNDIAALDRASGQAIAGWAPALGDGEVHDVTSWGANIATGGSFPGSLAVFRPKVASNTASPAIEGAALRGQTVTCLPGAWKDQPAGFEYAWLRDGQVTPVTTATYTIGDADVGKEIVCSVAAENQAGKSAPVKSAAKIAVSPPVNKTRPAVEGTTAPDQTLTCAPGTWDYAEGYEYRWLRNGEVIAGRTELTYDVKPSDAGAAIGCGVTATNATGKTDATSPSRVVEARADDRRSDAPPPAPSGPADQTPPPPPGNPRDTEPPSVRFGASSLRVTPGGHVAVPVGCGDERCTGTLRLSRGKTTIGTARFVAEGATGTRVKVKLTKSGRKLVKSRRALKVSALVKARDAAGNERTARRTVTLERAR